MAGRIKQGNICECSVECYTTQLAHMKIFKSEWDMEVLAVGINEGEKGRRRCQFSVNVKFTNLDSILKSRDITLPTKFRLVKAMVFPVAMYGCESWTVKKAER